MEKELVEEAEDQVLDIGRRPGRSSGRWRSAAHDGVKGNRAGGRRSTGAGLDGGASGSRAAPSPSSRIRGWPLALKYVVLISLLIILVSVLFGLVVASIFRTKLESEIRSYGRSADAGAACVGRQDLPRLHGPQHRRQRHGQQVSGHEEGKQDAGPPEADRRGRPAHQAAGDPGRRSRRVENPRGVVLSSGNPRRLRRRRRTPSRTTM